LDKLSGERSEAYETNAGTDGRDGAVRRVAVRRGGGDVLPAAADTPATSYDGAQAEYILRDYEGYVSVFASGTDRKPLQVTGIEVAGLRRADQELLRGGITVGSQEQLLLLLEDLGS
jgi:hypothetical protein